MVHRQEQHVGPDSHALRSRRYGCRNHERARQVAVVHEVVLRQPDARVPQPFGLLDLLEALRIEPRVVPKWWPLPEVIPESKGRTVCSQAASSADAPAPVYTRRGALYLWRGETPASRGGLRRGTVARARLLSCALSSRVSGRRR